MATNDNGPTKMGIQFDDGFTTKTTDAARIWFTSGDKPDDRASMAIIVRSVGFNNAFQMGMHVEACRVVREALENAFAPDTTISVLVARENTGDAAREVPNE